MKRVAILQSNYIPWKGYFDIINMVDLFIFHDDLQYTKSDWRNRNKIKTPNGTVWLTIPCGADENRLICDVKLSNNSWQKQHWNILKQHYSKTRYFKEYNGFFEDFYQNVQWTNLSDFNQSMIKSISKNILGIKTSFADSRIYNLKERKGKRVLELLKKTNATNYLSGPAAKDYIDENEFIDEEIILEWMDYSGYPEYHQLYPPFAHNVSIIDLLFNEGPNTIKSMKSFQAELSKEEIIKV
ncbi:MAG: WbqC family protein [Mariniphaga sp.]|nr:WbqC family protein [Mariniphaga sp.]